MYVLRSLDANLKDRAVIAARARGMGLQAFILDAIKASVETHEADEAHDHQFKISGMTDGDKA